jgi:hypothetical protein
LLLLLLLLLLLERSEWPDVLHCVLLLRTSRTCFVLRLQCLCALCGFMVASRDACPLCDKPFYGKQKFVHCGACEVWIHYVCLQLGEAKQAAISTTGDSVYRCDACATSLGSSSSVKALSKSPESLHHHGAKSCASSNEEASSLISEYVPLINTVLLLGAPMLPMRWVKISTYLHLEPFLSIIFLLNLKLLKIFVHTPNVLWLSLILCCVCP